MCLSPVSYTHLISMIFIVLKKRKKKQDLSNAEETVDTLRKMEKENLASSGSVSYTHLVR